jgi:hypothetical protein
LTGRHDSRRDEVVLDQTYDDHDERFRENTKHG